MLARQPWKVAAEITSTRTIFISWIGRTFLDELIWWRYCNMIWYDAIVLLGIKSCNHNIGDQLYNVRHWIKSSRNNLVILIPYHTSLKICSQCEIGLWNWTCKWTFIPAICQRPFLYDRCNFFSLRKRPRLMLFFRFSSTYLQTLRSAARVGFNFIKLWSPPSTVAQNKLECWFRDIFFGLVQYAGKHGTREY